MQPVFIFGILAFCFGASIPFFARRFGKFLPADAGTALVRSFHRPRFVRSRNEQRMKKRNALRRKLFVSSLAYGVSGVLCALFLNAYGFSPVFLLMFFICALLANIDERLCVLPDVLTVPLIITGFAAAAFHFTGIPSNTAAAGALAGFLLPTLASALMSAARPRSLGGGDYKMLAGVGAWMGFLGISAAILISFAYFILFAIVRKNKEGPYGNSLLLAVLTVFILEAFGNFSSSFVIG